MRILVDEIRLQPLQYVKAVLRHMGPEFWIVAIYPFYISWVWGSGEIFPGVDWLSANPTQAGTYLSTLGGWARQTWEFWVGIIVIGPLLGGGTVLYDDFFDRDVDPSNPRKRSMPFLKTNTRARTIMASAVVLFGAGLVLAALMSGVFLAVAVVTVVLSLLYSTPPVRLKGRAGLDVATNMMGFGVLCSLAGFSLTRPLGEYPWLWLVPMVLGTGALYVPTTVVDIISDGRNGIQTVAVTLGIPRAITVTFALLLMANVAILSLGLGGYLYDPWVVYRVWPVSVLELLPLVFLYRRPDIGKVLWVIFAISTLMAIGTLMLAFNHVGMWGP